MDLRNMDFKTMSGKKRILLIIAIVAALAFMIFYMETTMNQLFPGSETEVTEDMEYEAE